VLFTLDLEQSRSKTSFHPPRRDAANYHAGSLESNYKHTVKRTCFSSQASAWGIQRKGFRVYPVCDICVRTFSREIDRVSAMILSEVFGSSCRIAGSVSCRLGFPGRPSFRSSSMPRPTSLIRLNPEAQQYAAELDTSPPRHPSHRRKSMMAYCL
jgi:hypothetical protein